MGLDQRWGLCFRVRVRVEGQVYGLYGLGLFPRAWGQGLGVWFWVRVRVRCQGFKGQGLDQGLGFRVRFHGLYGLRVFPSAWGQGLGIWVSGQGQVLWIIWIRVVSQCLGLGFRCLGQELGLVFRVRFYGLYGLGLFPSAWGQGLGVQVRVRDQGQSLGV